MTRLGQKRGVDVAVACESSKLFAWVQIPYSALTGAARSLVKTATQTERSKT